jgi:hypothetical protein
MLLLLEDDLRCIGIVRGGDNSGSEDDLFNGRGGGDITRATISASLRDLREA